MKQFKDAIDALQLTCMRPLTADALADARQNLVAAVRQLLVDAGATETTLSKLDKAFSQE